MSIGLRNALRCRPVDILHFQYHLPFPPLRDPVVVTIHDMSFARIPHLYPVRDVMLTSLVVRRAVRGATLVITPSEHARQDVLALYGLDADKVITVPYAAPSGLRPSNDKRILELVRARHGIPPDYILYVGRTEPRKNLVRLAEAVRDAFPAGRLSPGLVIVGPMSFGWKHITATVKTTLGERAVFTGILPVEEVAALYAGSLAFVYPSIYEGFGFGVLEAMQCGAAVITSNVTSLPEVAGQAAVLVDPFDVDDMAHAIQSVSSDAGMRRTLREAGLRRAAEFTWSMTARATRRAYVLASNRR